VMSLANGRYVTARLGDTNGRYAMLAAQATSVGPWEKFNVGNAGSVQTIMSLANGKYVTARLGDTNGDYAMLAAQASSVGAWEQYRFVVPTAPVSNCHAATGTFHFNVGTQGLTVPTNKTLGANETLSWCSTGNTGSVTSYNARVDHLVTNSPWKGFFACKDNATYSRYSWNGNSTGAIKMRYHFYWQNLWFNSDYGIGAQYWIVDGYIYGHNDGTYTLGSVNGYSPSLAMAGSLPC
jgi:hypothetical protein